MVVNENKNPEYKSSLYFLEKNIMKLSPRSDTENTVSFYLSLSCICFVCLHIYVSIENLPLLYKIYLSVAREKIRTPKVFKGRRKGQQFIIFYHKNRSLKDPQNYVNGISISKEVIKLCENDEAQSPSHTKRYSTIL